MIQEDLKKLSRGKDSQWCNPWDDQVLELSDKKFIAATITKLQEVMTDTLEMKADRDYQLRKGR